MTTVRAAPVPIAATDPATQLLLADHREMRALLERYRALGEAGADAKERDEVGDELCELLIVHGALEHEIFYPAAVAAGADGDLIDGDEHGRLRDEVERIRALPADDGERVAVLLALAEAACLHADAEEAGLFAWCRSGPMDLEALGERLNERQAELLVNGEGRPQPEGGLAGLVKKVFG